MLFARAVRAVVAQGLVAAFFALQSSPAPWQDAAPWLPMYGTSIDAGCLALLWRLTHREGIGLVDLIGFDRARLVRDVFLGLSLITVGLVFIFAGTYAAGWLVYGTVAPPYLLSGLPLPAALYGVLVWAFIWGLTEQLIDNGYLPPRFQVLCRSTRLAVALVAFVWSLQHVVMPFTSTRSSWRFGCWRQCHSPSSNALVSATSPAASVRDRTRPVGRCDCADPRTTAVE